MKISPKHIQLKNGKVVVIREACIEDTEQLILSAKSYLRTSEYLCSYEDEFNPSLDEEKAWIKSHEHENSLLLVAIYENQILATFNATGFQNRKMNHIAVLGISILQDWRNAGLGKALFDILTDWAKNNSVLEKLILEVFADNTHAISLYKKYGFEIDGIRKNNFKDKKGNYHDNILMSLDIRK